MPYWLAALQASTSMREREVLERNEEINIFRLCHNKCQ